MVIPDWVENGGLAGYFSGAAAGDGAGGAHLLRQRSKFRLFSPRHCPPSSFDLGQATSRISFVWAHLSAHGSASAAPAFCTASTFTSMAKMNAIGRIVKSGSGWLQVSRQLLAGQTKFDSGFNHSPGFSRNRQYSLQRRSMTRRVAMTHAPKFLVAGPVLSFFRAGRRRRTCEK